MGAWHGVACQDASIGAWHGALRVAHAVAHTDCSQKGQKSHNGNKKQFWSTFAGPKTVVYPIL